MKRQKEWDFGVIIDGAAYPFLIVYRQDDQDVRILAVWTRTDYSRGFARH
jgi:hypothetical protein